MINIGPINYNNSNYRVVRTNNKVTPVSSVDKINNDRSNNDSNFGRNLDEEIYKLKKKKKKEERK